MAYVVAFGALLLLGAATSYWAAYRAASRPDRILGLLYHRIVSDEDYEHSPPTEKIFAISEQRFREQLQYLKAHGYHGVTLDAVLDYILDATPLPLNPFLVTFDDGSISVYERALPILQDLDLPAALFVTTDPDAWVFRLGTKQQRQVTAEEMRLLEAGGVTIGSHAVSHDALEAMSDAEIHKELHDSKVFLEEVLGHEVKYFAVPLNWYGEKVKAAAKKIGYRAVFTSDNGVIDGKSDRWALRRFIIEGSFTLDEFVASLRPRTIVTRRIVNVVKRVPARLLGPRIWMPLRRWLFDSFLGRYFTFKHFKRLLAIGSALVLLGVIVLAWWLFGGR